MKKKLGYLFVGMIASVIFMPSMVFSQEQTSSMNTVEESQAVSTSDTERIMESTDTSTTQMSSVEENGSTETQDSVEGSSQVGKKHGSSYSQLFDL